MNGCILKRKQKHGISWLLKYDTGKDPLTGKRLMAYKTVKGGHKNEARKELRRLLSLVDTGGHVARERRTFAEWVRDWLTGIEPTVSAKTFERYQELLNLHVVPYLGDWPLQRVASGQIEALYTRLRTGGPERKRKLSEATILHVHRVLNKSFSDAVRKQVVEKNPLAAVLTPRPERGKTGLQIRMQALDADQLCTLLKGFKGHSLYPLVVLAAATGARKGELLALRWSDVSTLLKTLRIERAVEDTNANGIRIKSPKNQSSRRTIGLDTGTVSLLEAFRHHRQPQNVEDLIFSEPSPRNVSKLFGKQASKLGFGGLRFHDLRHSHASQLLANGVAVNAVAARLGHSSPMVTLTVYSHVLKRSEDQAVSVVETLLRPALAAT